MKKKQRFKKECSLIYILYMQKWPFPSFSKTLCEIILPLEPF